MKSTHQSPFIISIVTKVKMKSELFNNHIFFIHKLQSYKYFVFYLKMPSLKSCKETFITLSFAVNKRK